MTYNELLSEIRNVFIERLETIVPIETYTANSGIPKSVYLDTIYSDIMALGYNFNDTKKAVDDIYEMQSALHKHSTQLYDGLKKRVEETAMLYPREVEVFSKFHKITQEGEAFEKAIEIIKQLLEVN